MDWKKLLGSVTHSVDQDLRLRNAYLLAENRILRQQVKGRLLLTDSDRQELAAIGRQLGRKVLEEIVTAVKADTILAWHRKFASTRGDDAPPRASIGRPRIAQEIEALVVRIARENRSWGYDRIVGALANLGYTLSDQTVGNILKWHCLPPAPERKKTLPWREFIRIHMAVLGATQFFSSDVWACFRLLVSAVLSCMCLDRYKSHMASITSSRPVWWMLLWLPWFLDGHTHVGRGLHPIREQRLLRLLCNEGIQGPRLATFVPSTYRAPRPQALCKVAGMAAGHPRPIRDGPMRRRQRGGGLLLSNDQKAA